MKLAEVNTEIEIQKILNEIEQIRLTKNEDYGESWKKMRPVGITDLISVKVDRIKQFENTGKLNHEGVEDSLRDIINYCLFRLIMYNHGEENGGMSN